MSMPPVPPMNPGFPSQDGFRVPKYNPLAIAGFVVSIVGGCCIALLLPVSLGLSIAGLVQINKDPQYQLGKGLAIAGIVISVLGVLFYFIGFSASAFLEDSGY